MDINNNSNISANISANITNNVISSLSKINLNTAKRAFETAKEELNNETSKPKEEETKKEDISLIDNKKTQKIPLDIKDVQKYADYMGEKLTIDDINYGLMYGRSVIADFSA